MPHYIYAAMVAAVMPLLSCPFTLSTLLLYALSPALLSSVNPHARNLVVTIINPLRFRLFHGRPEHSSGTRVISYMIVICISGRALIYTCCADVKRTLRPLPTLRTLPWTSLTEFAAKMGVTKQCFCAQRKILKY